MTQVKFYVADILFELSCPSDIDGILMSKKLKLYQSSQSTSPLFHVKIRLEESEKLLKPKGCLVLDGGEVGKVYRDEVGFCAEFSYFDPDNVLYHHGILFADNHWKNLCLHESKKTDGKWLCFLRGNANDLILRNAMIYTNGIILHAAFVKINNKGVCLLGHSGEGKSTISKIIAEADNTLLVNEDHVAVRMTKGLPIAYGVPWAGSSTIFLNENAPLGAVILLEKSNNNYIERISIDEAMPLVLARSFLPYWDESLMHLALDNIEAILNAVPVYLLGCKPEPAIIPLVRSVL